MNNTEKSIEGHVSLRHTSGQSADIHSVPPAIMQALYHEITGKTELLSRVFRERYIIDRADLRRLAEIFDQVCSQFSCDAKSLTAQLSFTDGQSVTVSSLQRLESLDYNNPAETKSISLEFGVLLSHPDVGRFHDYKVSIICSGGFISDEGNSRTIECDYRFGGSIMVSVNYIDYIIARTFLSSIDDWTKSLDIVKKPSTRLRDFINDEEGADYLLVFSAISSIALSWVLVSRYATSDISIEK